MTKSSKLNSTKAGAHITVKTVFHYPYSIAATATATSLGSLDVSGTGMWAGLQNVLNLGDMFRFVKINSVDFTLIPTVPVQTSPSSYISIPPSLLYLTPYGASIPTDIAGVENFPCGKVSAGFLLAYSYGSTSVLMKDHAPKLSLKHSELPIINAADPPGWLATNGDGQQLHFGTLVRVGVAAGAAVNFANINCILRSELDISFRDILDPTSISRVLDVSKSSTVSVAPGVLQGMVTAATKVPRLLSAPSINAPLPSVDKCDTQPATQLCSCRHGH